MEMVDDEVGLSALRATVSGLDAGHPLRTLVGRLPIRMSVAEYAALAPTLWALAERA
ncbi:MAG: hypothetical protein ABSA15_04995 [Thermoplasmata archaeon]|jgi:hypothetical protein